MPRKPAAALVEPTTATTTTTAMVSRRSARVAAIQTAEVYAPSAIDGELSPLSAPDEPQKPRTLKGKRKALQSPKKVEAHDSDNFEPGDEDSEPQKSKGQKRKRKTSQSPKKTAAEEEPVEEEEVEPQKPKAKRAKRKAPQSPKKSQVVNGPEGEEMVDSPKKRRRKVQEEVVYVIPDVEKKATTFKGRLGYACLNTILRNKKPSDEAVFCSRTCRIDTIKKNGLEWVKELGRKNVQDLLTIIQWNEDNNIRFFRLSSEMFPFASHPIYGYKLDYCADLLAQVGVLANKYGHRLTTHPGQFTQLGSNKLSVIEASVKELEYHCEMLDLMGIGPEGVMIIHGGGTYDDKEAAIERIKDSIKNKLSANVRARLVLENDEASQSLRHVILHRLTERPENQLCYNADDLLPVCEELEVPLVFDYHHDALFPSSIPPSEIIKRANAIFAKRGIKPKQHLSEPRPGAVTVMERRAHADRCESLPADLPDDMDLMIEAKDKEQAVLYLYRMYDLQPVIHGEYLASLSGDKWIDGSYDPANLRPPAENITKETKGRKSNKRAKLAAKEAVAEDAMEFEKASFEEREALEEET